MVTEPRAPAHMYFWQVWHSKEISPAGEVEMASHSKENQLLFIECHVALHDGFLWTHPPRVSLKECHHRMPT
jgi:hypothetical protein